MVRAWYMDTAECDQRDEHQCVPPRPVTLKELNEKTGVEYFEVPVEGDYSESPELVKIKRDRGYSYEDHVEISEGTLPNYEEKLKNFFTEHLHSDEEIRLVVKGSGYFDVRDPNDEWIRIELVPRDLIILPAGIYHRFTLDRNNYVKAMRFFVGEPIWTPINRPADEHPARVDYLKSLPCQTQVPQKA